MVTRFGRNFHNLLAYQMLPTVVFVSVCCGCCDENQTNFLQNVYIHGGIGDADDDDNDDDNTERSEILKERTRTKVRQEQRSKCI